MILQGPLSSYYSKIAGQMMKAGAGISKIHFCGNDMLDWRHKHAYHFTDTIDAWPIYLENLIDQHGVTDILLHGDRRPYHKIAVKLARHKNIQVWVTELGYLRPDWMTLELEGVSTLSRFTNNPEKLIQSDNSVHDVTVYKDSTLSLIFQELRFTLFNFLFSFYFRQYKSHRTQSPWKVYTGWLRAKISKVTLQKKQETVVLPKPPFFVMALQLDGDLQLLEHSPFEDMCAAIEYVMRSFKLYASQDASLILKTHPHSFNNKIISEFVETLSVQLGLSDRVQIIDASSIKTLCENAAGFVTINSSAGIEALEANCPVLCVMPTIYDMPGLTHQATLDTFWEEAQKPSLGILNQLKASLIKSIQVRGSLYNRVGKKAAAKAIAHKILADEISKSDLIEATPPRLHKARSMGVEYK